MNVLGNIEKRIKRHVLGKSQSFFVSTQPGLEPLCFNELLTLGLAPDGATMVKGGIEIEGRIPACYLANLQLRTASRILMRIATFGATNFRQLEKKLKNVPWELYLNPAVACDIQVATQHSRLYHKEAIAGWFRESVAKRWALEERGSEATQGQTGVVQQIFVRLIDDDLTVSIDSSGELLHKRGLKTQGGRAPIRETIAAAILIASGYDGREPVLDPMCGTGTFSLEAAMAANRIPAGWYRTFAFLQWPCFSTAGWQHMRREAEKSMIRLEEPSIFASDKDHSVCKRLDEIVRDNDLSGSISVFHKDFFDLQPKDLGGGGRKQPKGLVVVNPPYGRRLGGKDDSAKLFVEIVRKLKDDFKGWRAALVVPRRDLVKVIPFKTALHGFFHGGLQMTLAIGKID